MKITSVGRGTVLELRSEQCWSNGHHMVLDDKTWYDIGCWCKESNIYFSRSGNEISFIKNSDVTAFMLRWA